MATGPGINPKFEMEIFPPEEQRIIRKLSNHFYVTRALRPITITNSVYRAFLIRPSEDLSIVLNAERELAVLFSPYETFEARTLNAFDEVYDFFDDQRIDKSIRFLISKDFAIERAIEHYLAQNLEYPIIVPAQYKSFSGIVGDDAIINSIRTNFLIRDLFGHEAPLQQEYFYFGRDSLVKSVIDSHKTGQNVGLFGLRKSGKTSTIFAVQRRAKPSGVAAITIDCEDTEIHAKRYDELLFHIIYLIRRHFNLKQFNLKCELHPAKVSEVFKEALLNTLNQARSHVLLIFDEIENISPETASSSHWSKEKDTLYFWQILRAFFQSDRKYRITFCFVGTNPRLIETPKIQGVANPAFMFASHNYLAGLSHEAILDMINKLGFFMGLNFTNVIVSKIYEKFGGHPFFTRQLCSLIHHEVKLNGRPRTVSVHDFDQACGKIGGKIKVYLDDIVENLVRFNKNEYEILKYLANDDIDTFNEIARECPEYISHIVGYGIIRPVGESFEFSFNEIGAYFRDNSIEEGIEVLWKEIMSRRNIIERQIREDIFFFIRRKEQHYIEEAVWSCVDLKRLNDHGKDIRHWFSRGNSPLFLREEISIVKKTNLYGNETSNIIKYLWIINDMRKEAHAKNVSEKDMMSVRKAFEFVEDNILPPD